MFGGITLSQVFAVAFGGAIGSVARFVASIVFANWLGSGFPWGTLFVNVAGTLWLSWVATWALARPMMIDPVTRLAVTTGFAGGMTTFSTFVAETLILYQGGNSSLAWANVLCNLILGLSAGVVGIYIARLQGAV